MSQTEDSFFIVGIGSSAGGLKALEQFLDNCPNHTKFAFVIVQHLSPHYKSLMPELLSRHTELNVKEASDGDVVLPNNVYLMPGSQNIQIKNGQLKLTNRQPSNRINFSIDIFFNSLALDQKERALAIILSGTGSDGTKGAKSIKEVGGTVFVQSPESSSFDGMPKSAISEGLADYILPPNEMVNELIQFVSNPHYPYPKATGDQNNLESLGRILRLIKNYTNYDFISYKKPTLLRRTAKRISITKNETVEDYIDYLHNNPEEKFLLANEYLIGVTKFFRDQGAFDIIKSKIIPNLFENNNPKKTLKIWTVACSTGEEAYSMAILLQNYIDENNLNVAFKIFATDLDQRGLEVATKGIYGENIEAEIPLHFLKSYFIKKDNKYHVIPKIRKSIIFSKHDILHNPPFNKMDLISCRNMLIYMENDIQQEVLSSLHYALNQNGYLFLGSSENLGNLSRNFEETSSKFKIYKNIQPERLILKNKTSDFWRINTKDKNNFQYKTSGNSLDDKISKSINKFIMAEMNAVSVCVDDNFEILHATGKLKKYIQYPEEGYSNNLLKMLPDELNIPVNSAIRLISHNSEKKIEKLIKFLKDEELINIKLVVNSVDMVSLKNRCFLVTIIEQNLPKKNDNTLIEQKQIVSNIDQVLELKEALNETRENLQSTIEELETSNEEMQATNEEMLASNEELQSTNEELQSLNEELHTVNAELQSKNEELFELNADIENLMQNINVGTIFLDRRFHIRKFTPSVTEHFKLQQEDIGRSITDFSGTIGGEDLIKHSTQVIKTLQPFQCEIKNKEEIWFHLQIFPYRNQEDTIQGVVINFINIHNLKNAIFEKEKLNTFLTYLNKSNPAVLYIYDVINNQNIYSSSSIWNYAGYNEQQIINLGANVLSEIINPEDLPAVIDHHDKIKSLKDEEELQIEYRIVHKDTKQNIWVLSTDKVHERDEEGNVNSIIGVAIITTKLKRMEQKVRDGEQRYRLALESTNSGLWEWMDIKEDKLWWSDVIYDEIGVSKKTYEPSFSSFVQLIEPDQQSDFQEKIQEHIDNEQPFIQEVLFKTKNNGDKWFKINAQVQKEVNGKIKMIGTILNIDSNKVSQKKMENLNIELERFAYLASHDLKEPLRTITSFTDLFKEEYSDILDQNAFQYLDFIEQASSRMITLTNDLLIYSQLDDKSLNFEKVNFNDIVHDVLKDLKTAIDDNKAVINVDKLPEVVCDKSQIRQLFQNLIANGLKYRGEKSPLIHISHKSSGDNYEFTISDNGIGIDDKYQDIIFDVFKRLHSQEEYEGTGIGLANCKRIIDNHNGIINVKSKLNKGSDFIFQLPKKVNNNG
ncbi:chemotaxis protein CheB [Nonlabens sp. Asnod3-A02]|uniref:chemotaxis protein CheB n=1 Tax=Nonlabens sp. Asnod3-A02 TaxID=3160579 RepID=UPI00386535C5